MLLICSIKPLFLIGYFSEAVRTCCLPQWSVALKATESHHGDKRKIEQNPSHLSPKDRARAVISLLNGLDASHALVLSAVEAVRRATYSYESAGVLTHDRLDSLHAGIVINDILDAVRFHVSHEQDRVDEVECSGSIESVAAFIFAMNERFENIELGGSAIARLDLNVFDVSDRFADEFRACA